MDEGRKRVILIAAAILASRKLAQQDSARPLPGLELRDSGRDCFCRADHAGD